MAGKCAFGSCEKPAPRLASRPAPLCTLCPAPVFTGGCLPVCAHPAISVALPAVPTQQVSAAAPEAGETNPGGGRGGHLIHGTEGPREWRQCALTLTGDCKKLLLPPLLSHPGFCCLSFEGV